MLGGRGELLGGHKGYGLGLLVELFCAALSGGTWSRHTFTPETGGAIAHFFAALDLRLFGDPWEIAATVENILEEIRSSSLAEGEERIYIHGEKEREQRQKALASGVPLDEITWRELQAYGERFSLDLPRGTLSRVNSQDQSQGCPLREGTLSYIQLYKRRTSMANLEHFLQHQELPLMGLARQRFPRPRLENLSRAVAEALEHILPWGSLAPGARIAITAGSRGISNIPEIHRTVVAWLRGRRSRALSGARYGKPRERHPPGTT